MSGASQSGGDDTGRAQGEQELVWQYASQLTAGMLANPSRGHFSVKDTISLFDEVLHELISYARVRGEFTQFVSRHESKQPAPTGAEPQPSYLTEHPIRRKPAPLPYEVPTLPLPSAFGGNESSGPQQSWPPLGDPRTPHPESEGEQA